MAKIAAIDFDDSSARVVVAKITGSSFQVQSAFEIDVNSSFENDAPQFGKDLTEALGSKVGRCDALVSFGRGMSELRVISVPIVPDNELPDIVRFQAMRQFANCADDAPVDFLKLSEGNEDKKVLAATIPAEILENLKSGCNTAGLQLKGVKLRSTCSTALSQHTDPELKNYIIVDPSAKSFNLEVVSFGKLCLTRTIRSVPGDSSVQIVREIRRTLAAATNQIAEFETRSIVVFGNEGEFEGLRTAIEKELQFDIKFINPFDFAPGLSEMPERVGTYASLIGLLVDHTSNRTETIDFLSPRKKVESSEGSRVKWLVGIAAAALFLICSGFAYWTLSDASSKIAKVNEQIKAGAMTDKTVQETIANVEKIEEFDNAQAVWIRELANLSEDFSDPDFAIVNSATFALKANDKNEGMKITVNGYYSGIETPTAIINGVRDLKSGHQINVVETVLLSEKETDQKYYDHKFKGIVFRAPSVRNPEIKDEVLRTFAEKRTLKRSDDSESKGDEADDSKSKGDEADDSKSKGDEADDSKSKGDEADDSKSKGDEADDSKSKGDDADDSKSKGDEADDSESKGDEAEGVESKGEEVAK